MSTIGLPAAHMANGVGFAVHHMNQRPGEVLLFEVRDAITHFVQMILHQRLRRGIVTKGSVTPVCADEKLGHRCDRVSRLIAEDQAGL